MSICYIYCASSNENFKNSYYEVLVVSDRSEHVNYLVLQIRFPFAFANGVP